MYYPPSKIARTMSITDLIEKITLEKQVKKLTKKPETVYTEKVQK